jgi:hypothetical protein
MGLEHNQDQDGLSHLLTANPGAFLQPLLSEEMVFI